METVFIVLWLSGHKGKAGIAQIVEYRAAAAAATRRGYVVFFHTSGVVLFSTGFVRGQ